MAGWLLTIVFTLCTLSNFVFSQTTTSFIRNNATFDKLNANLDRNNNMREFSKLLDKIIKSVNGSRSISNNPFASIYSPIYTTIMRNSVEGTPSGEQDMFWVGVLGLLTDQTGILMEKRGLNDVCRKDAIRFVEGILEQNIWALYMLDAFGKPGSDLLNLQTKWLGSYEECIRVRNEGPVENISAKYCRATKPLGGVEFPQAQALGGYSSIVGVCVPDSCSASDISVMLATVQIVLLDGRISLNPDISCVENRKLDSGAIAGLCVLSVLGCLVLVGTFYDIFTSKKRSSEKSSSKDTNTKSTAIDTETAVSNSKSSDQATKSPKQATKSSPTKQKRLNSITKPSALGGIDGVRNELNGYHFYPRPSPVHYDRTSFPISYREERCTQEIWQNHFALQSGFNSVADVNRGWVFDTSNRQDSEYFNARSVYTDTIVEEEREKKDDAKHAENKRQQSSVLQNMLLSFSVYSNCLKILSTAGQGTNAFGALNGIRFLGMSWIILAHTFMFALGYDANIATHEYQKKKLNDWMFMAVPNANVSVDTFFVLSGILVANLSLKELKKLGGARKFNWPMYFFHRFWRLTPPYMLVLMVGTVLLPYVYSGPLWTDGEFPTMSYCRQNWWTNLLYINNYVHVDEMCMGRSWYLANDMQFYIICPLLFVPLFFNVIAGTLSCLLFLCATITTTALIVYHHEYAAQNIHPQGPEGSLKVFLRLVDMNSLDDDYMKNIYLPSYARMGPYIVGVFTGYIMYRCNCKCRIPKVVNIVCWFLCVSICCVVVYSVFSYEGNHILTLAESIVYLCLRRTAWGLAICWIVFSCATGHGGMINKLLSWKAFIPLGRLTYCTYLVHPLVNIMFYSGRRQTSYFTDYEAAYVFIGHLVMSYGAAFVVSLIFESPMMGLEKAIFKRGHK